MEILIERRRALLVLFVAALPVLELRGAIPLGLGMGMDHWHVFFLAVLGNLLPIYPFVYLLRPLYRWLHRHGRTRAFERILARTRVKSATVAKYGAVGLALFVAVPLPGTGAWTGALAAFLFGIPKRWALPAITVGTVIAGLIVTFLGETVKWLFF
ncbi:MAG: small multi-drug export protein [Firmicutes bacterium]|nr:small multi-drug export protein [Bacillota bacterium]